MPVHAPAFSVEVGRLSPSEWSGLLDTFDDSSVYQTCAYGAVHWDARELCHVLLRSGTRVVSAAQVRVKRLPLLPHGIAYLRWGPLWRLRGEPVDDRVLHAMVAALKQEFVLRRGLVLRVIPAVFEADPFSAAAQGVWTSHGFVPSSASPPYRTFRVDLRPPLEILRKQLDQKWRNCLNGAERNDLTVIEGTSLELYDRFLAIYDSMMARKQFETTVNVREFRRLQQELPEAHRLRVFLCEKGGQTLNAIVVSALGDSGIYLLGATSEEGLKPRGAYLLQWRALQWLKEHGCCWYDLGGINPETNPGVFHFKSGLGGQDVRQLAALELSGNWMSTFCVRAAENGRSLVHKLKSRNSPSVQS